MGQHLLREVLDTRYFYISIDTDFIHVMDTIMRLREDPNAEYFAGNDAQEAVFQDVIRGEEITFDMQDVRITSDCTMSISNATRRGIHFVDTKNPDRNALLLENRNRQAVTDAIDLPAYTATSDPIEYINNLRSDVVYKMPIDMTKVNISLIVLIALARPKVQFAMDNSHGVIFDYMADAITLPVLCKYTEFYYHTPEGIEVLTLTNGTLSTQRRGHCSIAEACEAGSLIPTVFGRERLITDPDWERLANMCLSALNAYKQAMPKTLGEVLKGV